jgi:hypothetical protein
MIRNMIIQEVRPETNIEWLWTLDLVERSWEILRYQRLKQRILEGYRHAAIKAILPRLEGAGIPAGDLQYLELQVGRSAAEWRDNPQAVDESTRACDGTASTTTPSMPKYFVRYEDRSPCSRPRAFGTKSTDGVAARNEFSAKTPRQLSKPSWHWSLGDFEPGGLMYLP